MKKIVINFLFSVLVLAGVALVFDACSSSKGAKVNSTGKIGNQKHKNSHVWGK